MKTREAIQLEYQNNAENLFVEYGDRIRELTKVRDAALAELDDPMLRLIAAGKRWLEQHYDCSYEPCTALRDAIAYAEQRRVAE